MADQADQAGQAGQAEQPRHAIRLHGPWELTARAANENVADSQLVRQRIKIPGAIPRSVTNPLHGGGSIILLRRFGTPTGLAANQVVELVVESISHPARLSINTQANKIELVPEKLTRADITRQLVAEPVRNVLEIEIGFLGADSDNVAIEIAGEIRLEIIG